MYEFHCNCKNSPRDSCVFYPESLPLPHNAEIYLKDLLFDVDESANVCMMGGTDIHPIFDKFWIQQAAIQFFEDVFSLNAYIYCQDCGEVIQVKEADVVL